MKVLAGAGLLVAAVVGFAGPLAHGPQVYAWSVATPWPLAAAVWSAWVISLSLTAWGGAVLLVTE